MHARRQRILLVTRNLPPLVGGMERLNWHMAEELAKVADVRVIGPADSAVLAPASVAVHEAPLNPLWRFLLAARRLARREAQQWQPDIILAGSGLTAPLARAAARACNAYTAVYLHGLDIAVRHFIYRTFWLPAIRCMDRVIANSHATAQLCRDVGVDSSRTRIVYPGVELPPIQPPQPLSSEKAFRQRHQLGDGPLLLSVGRLSERKGLREFVTLALPRIVAAQPGVTLLIVGDSPSQALHARSQTPESIQIAAEQAGVGDRIRFLGVITDYSELTRIYRTADIHVFPVRDISGNPEGFGMVAVEAAAHGLPTVAFATGGVINAVAEGKSGYLVKPHDYASFADVILQILTKPDALHGACVEFARQFAWPEFGLRMADALANIRSVQPP